jgi:hypothetical protein
MVEFEVKVMKIYPGGISSLKMRRARPKSEFTAEAGWIIFLMEYCLNF